ncbi:MULTISPECIES: HD domain-containing protein [unclassified Bradyrhizobium]|uniref:HD domain-containing protein n=1 Tax=unclassified Bradyrhizobium TaxID=2631580 RepID=UPI0028E799C6|nr:MULTISPECIES: HD domain-containing protein [unclassified Bradyrhizobium]
MLDRSDVGNRYDEVWRISEPYMRARKNDVHIPLSYAYARKLLAQYPDADEDIVSLAIILHDIGWYTIDMKDIIEKGFGPNMMQSDVRFLHESEGVRMSRDVLEQADWPENIIVAVGEIIDGHDTRPYPRSLNDRIVRDADKLWRYTTTGVAVACDWFKMTPRQYASRLTTQLAVLETEAGRLMAEEALGETRAALMLDLI